jgi:hypothetical protein
MSRRIILRAQAEVGITGAAIWYQQREAELGASFLGDVGTAIARAAVNPNQFPRQRRRPKSAV